MRGQPQTIPPARGIQGAVVLQYMHSRRLDQVVPVCDQPEDHVLAIAALPCLALPYPTHPYHPKPCDVYSYP